MNGRSLLLMYLYRSRRLESGWELLRSTLAGLGGMLKEFPLWVLVEPFFDTLDRKCLALTISRISEIMNLTFLCTLCSTLESYSKLISFIIYCKYFIWSFKIVKISRIWRIIVFADGGWCSSRWGTRSFLWSVSIRSSRFTANWPCFVETERWNGSNSVGRPAERVWFFAWMP